MGLFGSSSSSSQTTNLYDSSVNMADQALYVGAGAQSASGNGMAIGRDMIVDASVHQTLDAELAGKAFDTVANMASQSIASAMSASDKAMQSAAARDAAAGTGGLSTNTLAIIGGVLALGILAVVMLKPPRKT